MKTVITTDIHARWDKARDVFAEIGLINVHSADPFTDERQPGFRHIQNGDAVSLGYGEIEDGFIKWLFEVVGVDDAHLGNHELPAVWHTPEEVMFMGYEWPDEVPNTWIAEQLRMMGGGRDHAATQYVRDLYRQGKYKVATAVGKWVITHAGIKPAFQRDLGFSEMTPAQVADYINTLFLDCMETGRGHPLISGAGTETGGVMWIRPEPIIEALYEPESREKQLHQIIGHTGSFGPKLHHERLWVLDTPAPSKKIAPPGKRSRSDFGGVAALVTEDDGETFELFYEE